MRTQTGASIVAIVRDDLVLAGPGPDVRFEPGDLVGVLGTREQRAAFVALT